MVARDGFYYESPLKGYRGVTQGDTIYLTIFKLVVLYRDMPLGNGGGWRGGGTLGIWSSSSMDHEKIPQGRREPCLLLGQPASRRRQAP